MAMDAENRPWIHLAGALGKLVRNLVGDTVSQNASMSVVTRGKVITFCPGSVLNQSFDLLFDPNIVTSRLRNLTL